MENEKNHKIEFTNGRYYDPEEIPEPLRNALKEKLAAAKTVGLPDDPSGAESDKDFTFEGGPGLAALLKLLIGITPPPEKNGRKPDYPPASATAPGQPEDLFEEMPRPGPIEPASSGRVLWLTLIISAIFYAYYFLK